jgi:hypothetical protein
MGVTMRTREITEKELNEITKNAGEYVRAQSVEIRLKIKESLQSVFAAARNHSKASQPNHTT